MAGDVPDPVGPGPASGQLVEVALPSFADGPAEFVVAAAALEFL